MKRSQQPEFPPPPPEVQARLDRLREESLACGDADDPYASEEYAVRLPTWTTDQERLDYRRRLWAEWERHREGPPPPGGRP